MRRARIISPSVSRSVAQSGFSLLEVLVAFVIVALVATALFRLFSGGLNNAGAAEDWSRAVLVAQSQLEIAAAAQPLREGQEQGVDESGRIRWQARVAPYTPPNVDPDLERLSEGMATRIYRVTVDVSFPGANGVDRTLSLATVKLGPKSVL